jgi:hypothetical protein
MSRDLIIGGINLSQDTRITINQTYTTLNAISNRRLADGSLVSRNSWNGKLSTEITCTGYIPSGLETLDYTSTMTVSCIAPKAVSKATNAITIPTTRRTDAGSLPYGREYKDGKWTVVSSSLVGDVLTVTDSGGTQFQGFSWSITAEQV